MLDSDTKRRINTCRDILVGKVPDPKSQVEQITIALIYKFMEDMDLESEELGGERKFFTGEYQRYSWSNLVASGVSGQDMLNTYSEALVKMVENEKLPELFRNIFRNAYLPYRDPETLRSFLREINGFSYDHSERLGDAFEYLLSVLGSQGDAGQFRTPRHIIDFMVEIIGPKKDEVILDPACGTAGFLISSYKHILKANTTEPKPLGEVTEVTDAAEAAIDNPKRYSGDLLTTDDRERLANNIKGYDISPDMVRLSLVNLYLHGFLDPKVEEYDTLTSEDKWGETADVILANPPFMSPKGGIKPHTKFSIASKRSEVLFVDYIAEHLTPKGRAAIVVPEGIIFQSQSAYVDLRKTLVEKYLAAVISLPAGVFNPYSGVKTSILILDAAVAKASDSIAFFKVENDGFNLGSQRRVVAGTQLPKVKSQLRSWLSAARRGEDLALGSPMGLIVERAQIASDGNFNLSAERYRGEVKRSTEWPTVKIGEICEIARGASPRPIQDYMTPQPDGVNWIKIGDAQLGSKYIASTKEKVTAEGAAKSRYVKPGDFILSNSMSFGRPYIMATDGCIHDGWLLLRPKAEEIDQDFLYHILGSSPVYAQFVRQATGGVVNNLNSGIVSKVEIPLPPLDMQREIVTEIEGYQKVIDGARSVHENYRPHIPIDPVWPMKPVKELVSTVTPPAKLQTSEYREAGDFPIIDQSQEFLAGRTDVADAVIDPGDGLVVFGDHTCVVKYVDQAFVQGADGIKILKPKGDLLAAFLAYFLEAYPLPQDGYRRHFSLLKEHRIAVPPLAIQEAIVEELDAEQALVDANRELIARFEKKIEAAIDRVWGASEEAVAA